LRWGAAVRTISCAGGAWDVMTYRRELVARIRKQPQRSEQAAPGDAGGVETWDSDAIRSPAERCNYS